MIEALNTFAFKVIVERYVFITILLFILLIDFRESEREREEGRETERNIGLFFHFIMH